jgi:NAD(P)-dependent dehydrogenase (short-subunit alcohol dehydrogenase family)
MKQKRFWQKSVKNMMMRAVKRFGKIDVLVNNAYVGFAGGEIDEVPWEVYQKQIDGILKGGYNCISAVLPFMRKQKQGSIINIGTASLYEGVEDKYHTPYTAAKGALLALTHGLANDLGKDNIRVNMVSPAICWVERDKPQPKNFFKDHEKRTPLSNRNAEAKDVAGVIIFYASHLSTFVTGTHLPVCGGLVMCVG